MSSRAIAGSAVVVAGPDLLASDFESELVILNLRDGVYYGLEGVGARIWALLQKPVSVSAIRDALVEEYDVEPSRCERDVRALVAELVRSGLVEVRNAS